jgi:HlyD family secretion protein
MRPIGISAKLLVVKIGLGTLIVLNLAVLGWFLWQHFRTKPLGPGFASGNGRIEAVEFDCAAKEPGSVTEM